MRWTLLFAVLSLSGCEMLGLEEGGGGSSPAGASPASSIELTPLDGAGAAATSDAAVDQARAEEQAAMSYGDRFKGFAMLVLASACFFGLALFFL